MISTANPGGTVGACGVGTAAGGSVGAGSPVAGVENGTATADAVPAIEQVPAGGCEETVISEFPLPSGGSVKVTVTPC